MTDIPTGLIVGDDGAARCWWGAGDPTYRAYHDLEWGRPVRDDSRLLEKLCLEGFQAGLSWLTILKKRPRFREVFHGFDLHRVAAMGPADVETLLGDAGIVRHRGKITSTLNNARRALEVVDACGSFADYVWGFEPPASERPTTLDHPSLLALAKTPASSRLAKDLKRRGFTFVGPTTVYAFMQAMGLVNDHLEGCAFRHLPAP